MENSLENFNATALDMAFNSIKGKKVSVFAATLCTSAKEKAKNQITKIENIIKKFIGQSTTDIMKQFSHLQTNCRRLQYSLASSAE